jgi:hypothetical protein
MRRRWVLKESIEFYGHPNVLSTHEKTIEVTKDDHLTARGDCIIGVRASKGCSELSEDLKSFLRDEKSKVKFEIEVDNERFEFFARGSPLLSFEDEHEIVIRMSDYASPRTLAVNADKAACDVPRSMVQRLKNSNTRGVLRIYAWG